MNDLELYASYFPVGKKVGVGIPLPNAEVFKEWAVIHELDEDLVSLQLSRDVLPAGVTLHYGQILELRGGSEGNGYCCRAIVVSEGDARELLLRLIGEIVSDELREFYRIDAFLPIKYFVSQEQNSERLLKQWESRRSRRQQLEIDYHEGLRWTDELLPADGDFPLERHVNTTERGGDAVDSGGDGQFSESWDTIIPLAANVSGGGLRIVTHQGFENGEYILLEILVPSTQRVIDAVGRVVFANRNYAAGSEHEYFNTGVQFVYIDERDRDAVINYISTIQLKRIRQLRERYLFRGMLDDEQSDFPESYGFKRKKTFLLLLLMAVIMISVLGMYFWRYAQERPKGEIERTFEEGVKQYQERSRIRLNGSPQQ